MDRQQGRIIFYAKKMSVDELLSASIYRSLASMYKRKSVVEKLLRMADMETMHAEFWARFLMSRKVDISSIRISRLEVLLRTMFYRLIGIDLTLKLLELNEREAVKIYASLIEDKELSADEKRGAKKYT